MGIQLWGAFGGFQKKTGPLVGRWRDGQNVITAIPHPSQEPASEGQLNFRAKFKLVVSWIALMTPIVRVGFQNAHEEKRTAFNAAFMDIYENAVTGTTAANFTIDYANVVIAKGNLSVASDAAMATTVDAQLDFTWQPLIANGIGGTTDKATFVVYNPARQQFVTAVGAAPRSALTYDMGLPSSFSGDNVYVWMFMVAADGKINSASFNFGSTVVM